MLFPSPKQGAYDERLIPNPQDSSPNIISWNGVSSLNKSPPIQKLFRWIVVALLRWLYQWNQHLVLPLPGLKQHRLHHRKKIRAISSLENRLRDGIPIKPYRLVKWNFKEEWNNWGKFHLSLWIAWWQAKNSNGCPLLFEKALVKQKKLNQYFSRDQWWNTPGKKL